jgi:hypothetical protein
MTFRTFASSAALVAVTFALAGCSSLQKKEPPACPPVYVLGDASRVTKFKPGPGRDLTDVEVEAEIASFKGECGADDEGVRIELQVTVEARRGPADTDRKAELSYFLAIPAFFPAPEAKAVFPVAITFPEGDNTVRYTDEVVTLTIPVKAGEDADQYEVYVGFQTSQEELERNRKSRR